MRGVEPIKEVIYQVDESGYTVAVVEEGTILEEYSATNNPWASQGLVVTDGCAAGDLAALGRGTRLGNGRAMGYRAGCSRSRRNSW